MFRIRKLYRIQKFPDWQVNISCSTYKSFLYQFIKLDLIEHYTFKLWHYLLHSKYLTWLTNATHETFHTQWHRPLLLSRSRLHTQFTYSNFKQCYTTTSWFLYNSTDQFNRDSCQNYDKLTEHMVRTHLIEELFEQLFKINSSKLWHICIFF